ncbi:hypothetical protein V8B97DRAFT_1865968 [Scleroderma yunnanense]
MGNVIFMITNRSPAKERSSTRDNDSLRVSGTASVQVSPIEMILSEKVPSMEGRASPPPKALTPVFLPSPSDSHRQSHVPPQPPPTSVSSDALAPHIASPILSTPESHSQLPQVTTASSPKKSGVDQLPTGIQPSRHVSGRINNAAFPEGSAMNPTMTLTGEDGVTRGAPESPSFRSVLCDPPEDLAPGIPVTPCFVAEPQSTEVVAPSISEDVRPVAFSQINIIISSSSRSGSPLSISGESDGTNKKGSAVSGFLHVNTGTASQGLHTNPPLLSGQAGELSPTTSPQPATSTTHNSGTSCLSPFSQNSFLDSPSTAATSPSLHSIDLPSSPGRQQRQRPKIDTSCVGPRGQVRKYTVPPINPPTKLRNGSLDLPRHDQYGKFENNHSMYSIAPSVSSFKSAADRCPSTQRAASRQSYAPSPLAPSIRREQLEYDDTQICLDTANLGDQEVAAFLREVDAALSAITNRSAVVASDGPAFLSVPNTGRISSRQSRRPSRQQLRAEPPASTYPPDDWEGAVLATWAAANRSSHTDGIPSRFPTPLSGLMDYPRNLSFPHDTPQLKLTPPDADVNLGTGPLISVENTDEKGAVRMVAGSKADNQSQNKIRVPFYPASQGPPPQPPSLREITV